MASGADGFSKEIAFLKFNKVLDCVFLAIVSKIVKKTFQIGTDRLLSYSSCVNVLLTFGIG